MSDSKSKQTNLYCHLLFWEKLLRDHWVTSPTHTLWLPTVVSPVILWKLLRNH